MLSFYRGQEKRLSDEMRKLTGSRYIRYFPVPKDNAEVEVCTVDRFQGQEADIVFLSMTRTRGIGFLDNRNRVNVALTRAKYQLVIVGSQKLFRDHRKKGKTPNGHFFEMGENAH